MARPIRATIHLDALRHNYHEAKRRAPGAKAWAVVKANAYGHGIERAARALAAEADGFALLDLAEAVTLRRLGVTRPILLLEGFFTPDDLDVVAAEDLSVVLHCREQVEMLLAARQRVAACIKLNTGMNRLGFGEHDLPWLRQQLPSVTLGAPTLMTHFADADGSRGIAWQIERVRAMWPDWRGPRSFANSAAILAYPEAAADWVRPGIMLYGGSPFVERSAGDLNLKPAMTLESRLIAVQTLAAGDRVGYGGTFAASGEMRIGVVACGYADGYPRHAASGTPVLVDGVRTRLVGRVSMDMITVDLGAVPQARIGTPVVLWGEGLSADEVAASAGTISYELFCALARRVPIVESDAGAA